jgi:hypothetical protein
MPVDSKIDPRKLLEGDEEAEADEQAINPEILRTADFSLIPEFEEEIMAVELLDYLSMRLRLLNAWRAARNSGNHQRAQELYRQMAMARLSAALIQGEHPNVKSLADDLAKTRVIEARNRRRTLLDEEHEEVQ